MCTNVWAAVPDRCCWRGTAGFCPSSLHKNLPPLLKRKGEGFNCKTIFARKLFTKCYLLA